MQSLCSPTRAFLLARPRSTTVSLSFPDECQARPSTWQRANLQKRLLAGAREGMEYSICCLNNLKGCPSVLLHISSFDLYFPTLCDVVLITSARQHLGTSSSMKQLDGCTGYEMLIQFPHWNHLPAKYGHPLRARIAPWLLKARYQESEGKSLKHHSFVASALLTREETLTGLWKYLQGSLRKRIFTLCFICRNTILFIHLDDDWETY